MRRTPSRRRTRAAVATLAVASLAVALPSAADAALPPSAVTAPAAGTVFEGDGAFFGGTDSTVPVTGTIGGGTESVDVYQAIRVSNRLQVTQLGNNLPVAGGRFSGQVTTPPLTGKLFAVPGDTNSGDLTLADVASVSGPVVRGGGFQTAEDVLAFAIRGQARGLTQAVSLGAGAFLGGGNLFGVPISADGDYEVLFVGAAGLGGNPFIGGARAARAVPEQSQITVDGRVATIGDPNGDGPGGAGLRILAHRLNTTNGDLTFVEEADLTFENDDESTSSAGITLRRTTVTSADGQQIRYTDAFTSTDGRAHAVVPTYNEVIGSASSIGGGDGDDAPPQFRIGWVGGAYSEREVGAAIPAGPKAPASIGVIGDGYDAAHTPRGAVTFDRGTAGGRFESSGFGPATRAAANPSDSFLVDQPVSVPARGTGQVRHAYTQAFDQATVNRLVDQAERDYGKRAPAPTPIPAPTPTPGPAPTPTPAPLISAGASILAAVQAKVDTARETRTAIRLKRISARVNGQAPGAYLIRLKKGKRLIAVGARTVKGKAVKPVTFKVRLTKFGRSELRRLRKDGRHVVTTNASVSIVPAGTKTATTTAGDIKVRVADKE